ncbi:MAG: hypothetical protein AAB892_01190 [Patescibacteria group bacterium]
MKKNTWLVIGIIVLVLVGIWFASASTRGGMKTDRTTREVALACTTDMATEFHIHPVIAIYVNGEQQIIPANVGIKPSCMTALHTHTADGLIHVESPEKRDFTVADFFAVWEKPFSATQIFEHVADGTHRVRMTVNGVDVDTFENTVLVDNDLIAIYYETI